MRRALLACLVACALVVPAMPAGAGRPLEIADSGTHLGCWEETGAGWVETMLVSHTFGSYGFVAIWDPGTSPEDAPPSLVADESAMLIELGDGEAALEAPLLVAETGEPAGEVEVWFSFEEGDTWPVDDRYREGNRWVEVHGTQTSLIVVGTARIARTGSEAVEVEMTECWGDELDLVYWQTNPTASTDSWRGSYLGCSIPTDGGVTEISLGSDEGGVWASLAVLGPSGWEEPPIIYGSGTVTSIGPGPLTVDFEMIDGVTDEPAGTARLEGTIESGETSRTRIYAQNSKETIVETALTLTGELSLPAGEVLDLDGWCSGVTQRSKAIWTQPHGPKPGGTPPVNDLPESAVALLRGDNAQTKGAAWEPEATCVQEWEEETWEIPLGKTVWYTIRGTGDEVTVSTTGTHFDTVLAVYDSEMGQIACVDDVLNGAFSLQAEVTFPTETGETYLVQAGGFDGQYGLLKLTRP